tara:strand:+ start:15933 stop:18245 length:2313 start_codon:yes stop_codon:yes gene_type:complete
MATYEVKSPGGETFQITAPDGASEQDVMRYAKFSFKSQAAKSKIDPAVDAGEQAVRGINRGLNSMVALPGEIASGAASLMGFPETAEKLRWNNPASRFMQSAHRPPQTTAGRLANASGQAIGASAAPMGTLMSQAPRLAARVPQTTFQAIKQRIAQPLSQNPGAAIAAETTSAATSGMATQVAKDEGYGPVTQTLAGIAGGVAPAAIGLAAAGTINQVRSAAANQGQAGAYNKVVEGLPGSVDDMARGIATGDRARSVPREIALRVLGEEMMTNGNAQAARSAAIPRIILEARQAGHSINAATAKRHLNNLQSMHRDSPLMLGEQPSVTIGDDALRGGGGGLRKPQNVDIEALNKTQETSLQGKFDYLATSGNSQSAVNTRRALNERGETLSPTIRNALEEMGPRAPGSRNPATIVDADDMIQQATRSGSAAYKVAEASPVNNRLALTTFPRILKRAEQNAAMRAGDKAQALKSAISQFYTETPNGPVAMMTLRQMQDARGTLRGQIQAYKQNGRDDLVQAVQPLYNQVTRLMSAMSPEWATANRQWADMKFDVMGRELGDAFSQRAGPKFRTQMNEFNGLHPEAQDIVRIHFLQSIYDKLDNIGDAHSVSKLFTNDHQRNAIGLMLGDKARNDFTRIVRNIKTAERSFQMNSRTHIRGEVKSEMEGDQGIEAARQMMSLSGIRDWVARQGQRLLTERKNKPLADIVTTPMSNMPKVALQLERMRRQQQRMQMFAQPKIRSQGLIGTSGNVQGNISAQPYQEWLKTQSEE